MWLSREQNWRARQAFFGEMLKGPALNFVVPHFQIPFLDDSTAPLWLASSSGTGAASALPQWFHVVFSHCALVANTIQQQVSDVVGSSHDLMCDCADHC